MLSIRDQVGGRWDGAGVGSSRERTDPKSSDADFQYVQYAVRLLTGLVPGPVL
jgi:hypothetical protein